jgi:putative ABC transport system substrate-binding protein
MSNMRRREFITLLGGAAVVWPVAARAQQPERMRRIGVLSAFADDDPDMQAWLPAFRQGLERLGWSEGRNVRIDTRFARANVDQHQALAKELVALQPDVIVAQTTPVVTALQRESRALPIVFVYVSDPVGSGLVASLARPGGNLTGLLLYEASIVGKWLAMLREIAPRIARAALVADPKTPIYDYFLRAAEAIAPSLAIELVPSPVETAADIERAIESFARAPNGGLFLPPNATIVLHRDLIIARSPPSPAGGLRVPSIRRGWWSRVLRDRPGRRVAASGALCRPRPARRQSRRPSGSGADQVRNGRQPQDSEGARPDRAAGRARRRR